MTSFLRQMRGGRWSGAVLCVLLASVGPQSGCGDQNGQGSTDAGLDSASSTDAQESERDGDVAEDARWDGSVTDCEIGAKIEESCSCGGEVFEEGWCCDSGHLDHPCAAPSCSEHIVDVDIPSYDPTNPEHFLIRTEDDWTHINDPDKRVFFVAPNTSHAVVTITSGGTADQPRILALQRDDDKHPAMLSPDEQAKVRLVFDGASHWVVDRLSSLWDEDGTDAVLVEPASHDLLFNRMNIEGFHRAFFILGNEAVVTRNIVIQKCRMDTMRPEAIDGDNVAILLGWSPWNRGGTIENVAILENEIRNANDGIMPIRHPNAEGGHLVNYPGLLIDCNHIYVDQDVYTDGNGNPSSDPDAEWALTENAVDIKGGSDDPEHPVVVSNNVFWGFRHTDQNGGGSGSWGAAIVIHYDSKNVVVSGNVIFDSERGLAVADPGGLAFAAENLVVEHNIFYNIGKQADEAGYAAFAYSTNGAIFRYNTIVGGTAPNGTIWYASSSDTSGLVVQCNAAVSCLTMRGSRPADIVVEDNYHYDTELRQDSDGTYFPNAGDAHLDDLVFWTDVYTANPRQITIPGVVTTTQSPHAGWCGSGQ